MIKFIIPYLLMGALIAGTTLKLTGQKYLKGAYTPKKWAIVFIIFLWPFWVIMVAVRLISGVSFEDWDD